MKAIFLGFILVYFLLIGLALLIANKKNENTVSSLRLFDKSLLSYIGFLTYAATLFSTFTLLGLPNFFRTHGVGAWVFLGITDTALVAFLLWVGLKVRKKLKDYDFKNMASLLYHKYKSPLPKIIYLITIFLFLMPYVAIQIRGVSAFLQNILPSASGLWGWGIMFTFMIVIYSAVGGIRAIVYSDIFQAVILLVVTYLIAFNCIEMAGGMESLFTKVANQKPQLLTVPGPKGLFSTSFLLISFITIILMTITQPQLFTRMMIIKSNQEFAKMAIWLGIFAFIVILPTTFIGLYGSVYYYDLAPDDFWTQVFINDQNVWVGGLLMLGLLSAAMSTADSQIFALEGEFDNPKQEEVGWGSTVLITIFAIISLLLALLNPYQDELVKLATLSFQGTALTAPMILSGIFSNRPNRFIAPATGLVVLIFIFVVFGYLPTQIMDIHIVFYMLGTLSLIALKPADTAKIASSTTPVK